MAKDVITAVEVQETDFGEKIVLQSPFEAKDFITVLPWKEFQEEVAEYGSLREKAVSRGIDPDSVAIQAIEDYIDEGGLSDTFAAHASWESDALGRNEGAWMIDVDAWDEAQRYFEFCGFETENKTDL